MVDRLIEDWDRFAAARVAVRGWGAGVTTRGVLAVLARAEAEALEGSRRSAACDGREIARALGVVWGDAVIGCLARADLVEDVGEYVYRLTGEGRALAGTIDQEARERRSAAIREVEGRRRAIVGRDRAAAERAAFTPNAPEPERLAKGDLATVTERDPDLKQVRHLKARGTLQTMLARGTITNREFMAGVRVAQLAEQAAIPDIQAVDWSRPIVDGGGFEGGVPSGAADAARCDIWALMRLFGGQTSAGGSMIWHVLALGDTIGQWCERNRFGKRKVQPETAGGILVATLAAIAERLDDTNNWGSLMPARTKVVFG